MVTWPTSFRNPYPYYYKEIPLGSLTVVIFLMSLGFNYLFEPFEVYRPEHRMGYFWISIVHSFNAMVVAFAWFGVWNRWVIEKKWTIGKEMLLIAGYLVVVGISQFLVRDFIYDNQLNWTTRYLYEEIRNTFLVGILFACILIPLNFLRLQRSHRSHANHFNPVATGTQKTPVARSIFISTRQKSDDFTIDPKDLLLAKAEGNYLEIYIVGPKTEKHIKRMTLKDLENQLQHLPNFCKTHRSYLVNLAVVEQVKGNAQGLQLGIPGLDFTVPVSRAMIQIFERHYSTIKLQPL